MNPGLTGWLPATVVPELAIQQVFHAASWLALLSWCTVAFIPVSDKRWRWLVGFFLWTLLMSIWSEPLLALGMAFQTPALLTLCLCLGDAWQNTRSPSPRLFYAARPAPVSLWLWWVVALMGWYLLLETFGAWPSSVYVSGFGTSLPWLGWLCSLAWLLLAYALDLPAWHVRVAGCWLLATGVFVFTRAPSGNVWDAWLDPWLWLLANVKLGRYWWHQRIRSNHS